MAGRGGALTLVPTGEEEEDTVYQTRCKLYALDDQGGWRERGVGNLKLNKHKATDATRLVMRSEGVLRVILNASLYVGMTCLEDGKHVRTTVFEGKDRTFITIRVSFASSSELTTDGQSQGRGRARVGDPRAHAPAVQAEHEEPLSSKDHHHYLGRGRCLT